VAGGSAVLRTCRVQPVTLLMLAPARVALFCRGMVSVVRIKALGWGIGRGGRGGGGGGDEEGCGKPK